MDLVEWTEEHKLFRETVRKFVDKEIRPYVLDWEKAGHTPRAIWKRCGEMGFLGINYPKEFGGQDSDYIFNLIFQEELARCGSLGAALGICVQTDMATPAIHLWGSDYLKRAFLRPAILGDMICSIAVTEPGCGSDVAGLTTRAVRDGHCWVINGRKVFITNGTQADFLTLLARTSDKRGTHSFSLFVVPTNIQGVNVGRVMRKTCYHASDTAEILLEDVRIPYENLIGEEGEGFVYQMKQFQFERLAASIQMIGAMKRSYDLTKEYIRHRVAFGQKLGQMQVTRFKMAQMLAEITAVESLAHVCGEKASKGEDFTTFVSMLKLLTSETLQRVTGECVQLHGGYGLMEEVEVARYFRDSKLGSIGGGASEVMKEIICRAEGI